MLARSVISGCVLSALLGCSDPAAEPEPSPTELVIEPLMYVPEDQPVHLLEDGGNIDLFLPPQGGFVVLVGAQIDHSDSDVVDLEASLRDVNSGELVVESSRSVKLQRLPGHPTKYITDRRSISQVVHLTLCPSEQPGGAVDQELSLELTATELYSDFTTGTASMRLTPICNEVTPAAQAYCECLCGPNYVPGKCNLP